METAVTSMLLGLLSSASPCVLPLYPGFLAYLSGQSETPGRPPSYLLGGLVLAGVLSAMLALGGLIALLALPIGRALAFIVPLVDALILVLGVLLLVDRNPFQRLGPARVPVVGHPLANAYLYGALYGPIALPCSGPLVVSIFALSLTLGEAVGRLWVFAWFGLGLGVPLLVLSALSGTLQRRMVTGFTAHRRLITAAGGLLLIGVAIYDLGRNWEMVRSLVS